MIDIQDKTQLILYLGRRDILASPENIMTLAGGVSNKTVLVQTPDQNLVIKQALEKLLVSADWFCDPTRIYHEAEGMRWLNKAIPGRVPQLLWEDRSHNLLAMEAIGQPHKNFKDVLMSGRFGLEEFTQFGDLLGQIHLFGINRANAVRPVFADRKFYIELRESPYYHETVNVLPESKAFFTDLIKSCQENCYTLVHGDYSPKNVLVRPQGIVLLDHEVIHFGDGAFDIGFALSHLLAKMNHLESNREKIQLGAKSFWSAYCHVLNNKLTSSTITRAVQHALGCLLARVHGKSTLDYLTTSARSRQSEIAMELVRMEVKTINELIDLFRMKLDND